MLSGMKNKQARSHVDAIWEEFAGAKLGDARLERRFEEVVRAFAKDSEKPIGQMFATEKEREGGYRFIRNSRIDFEDILRPHIQQTVGRAEACDSVLVLHDTTEIKVHEEADIDSYLRRTQKGFRAHVSLAVSEGKKARPWGVLCAQTIERKRPPLRKKNKRSMSGSETAKLKNKEYQRWFTGIEESAEDLAGCSEVTHVMDAETDSYALMAWMDTKKYRFVLRATHNRRVKTGDSQPGDEEQKSHLRTELQGAQVFEVRREVRVSKRKEPTAPKEKKRKPGRQARTATLQIAAKTVELKRPRYLREEPETLSLTAVHVRELNPPEDVQAIEWILYTNQEVTNAQEAQRIVDMYRQRWLIEEFFKVVKTGCGYRKRKLTNRRSIFHTLALSLPIAWHALLLRECARDKETKATEVFSETELQVLEAKAQQMEQPLPPSASAHQALLVIAQIGGYRPTKHPPGWLVLFRGMKKFRDFTQGWILAMQAMGLLETSPMDIKNKGQM